MMEMLEKLSPVVEDDEPLARYIFSKSHFSKINNRIKRQAFMPPKGTDKVSVIRCQNCPENCILKIGQKTANKRKESLKAVASIITGEVRSIENLDVESDTSGGQHRRHAHIKVMSRYPDAKIRQIAQKLANKAHLLYVM